MPLKVGGKDESLMAILGPEKEFFYERGEILT